MSGRRDFLAFTVGAVAAGTVLPAVGVAAELRDVANVASSDAELLALIAAFNDLEHTADDLYPGGANPIVNDRERDAVLAPIRDRQSELVEEIYEAEAQTLEGVVARARSFVLSEKEVLGGGSGFDDDLMLAALLRDLLAVGGQA